MISKDQEFWLKMTILTTGVIILVIGYILFFVLK